MEDKRPYFNDLADRWDSMPGPDDADDKVKSFCKRACPVQAKLILDVGCGTGLLAPYLVELLPSNTKLVELDFAVDMLRRGRGKNSQNRIRYVCADALQPPFEDSSFDAVLCFGILPHLGDPETALGWLWRILRPGGTLAVGHLMGSVQLNELHQNIGGPVGGDRLPAAAVLESILRELSAVRILAEDAPQSYFVRCEKGAE